MSDAHNIIPTVGLDGGKANRFIELNTANIQEFERALKHLEADINQFKSDDNVDSKVLSQALFCRKVDLMHQFNLLINQQSRNNHHDSPFISNFDQQRLLNKLKDLESKIFRLQSRCSAEEERENTMESKAKKFSFRKTLQPQAPSITTSIPSEAKPSVPAESPAGNRRENPFGLKLHSENLFIRPSSPLAPLHILALSDLSNVVLDLRALTPHLSTLQLSRIYHGAVLAPPLSGSASLAQVSRSILLLVSQQVRTYESEDLTLLLHTNTGPVIERSERITIGPYPFDIFPPSTNPISYPSQHHLSNDFDCPDSSTTPSPNLSIVPASPIPSHELSTLFQPSDQLITPDNISPSLSCFVLPQPTQAILMKL